jgi:hypothetical protein
VAEGSEAGDRGGIVCTRLVGLNGRAIRRECEPGIQLAEALSRRAAWAGRPVGSSTDPGGGFGGTGCGGHATPNDIMAPKAALVIEAARAMHPEAELAVVRAKASDDQALFANQQLQKLRRQIYGQRSERISRLLAA